MAEPKTTNKPEENPQAEAFALNTLLCAPLRVEIIIRNAHRMLRRRYKGQELWIFIKDVTSFGSGYSWNICEMFGWNPVQDAGDKLQNT